MSCVDDENFNATEGHQEIVTIDPSDSFLQLQELQESSSWQDPIVAVSSHELATFIDAEMDSFETRNNNPPEECPSVMECSMPQVMGLIGIMLYGSLTALEKRSDIRLWAFVPV